MAKIKFRRDTAAAWTLANPTLAQGEPGFEYDTGLLKIGDGATAWTALDYSSGSGGNTLNDEGGVVVTSGSTAHWVATQRRESKDIYGRGVRYDSQGNAYALTQTQDDNDTVTVITKYSTTGTLLWQHTIDQATPCALAVDSSDCAYIVMAQNPNVDLIKFTDDGIISWKKSYDAGAWQGEAFIEERTANRLVMTMNRDGGDYGVLVFDINTATGDVVTQKLINLGGPINVHAGGIDTDAGGNVFVTGRYNDIGANKYKMFVEKLDGSLNRVWSKSLETDNNYDMNAGDCASDAQGNVYAVGYYSVETISPDGTDTATAGVLIKLNSSGVTQWTRRLGPGPCGESVVGLTATATGEVYLVTTTLEFKRSRQLNDFEQMVEGTARMIVAKYDTAGAVLWQRYVDAKHTWENADTFRGQTIAVYGDKFIVDFYGLSNNTTPVNIGGTSDHEADFFLVQLPTDGTALTIGDVEFRESRIPGRFVTHVTATSPLTNDVFENTVDVATSTLTLDTVSRVANGLVKSEAYDYVFGADGTLTIPNDGDVKLTQNQTGFFSVIGPTVNNDWDIWGRAVTADSQGNTYVVGSDNDYDQPLVVKISPEGHRLWSVSIEDNTNNRSGRANGLALHPTNGNVYVACEMYGSYTYGLLVVLDQDTGRVLDSADYTDASNDVYLNDIAFQSDNAYVIGGSKNGNFSAEQTVTSQTGSGASTLIVLRSEVTGIPTNNWQIGGTGFSVFENLQSVESYTALTSTVREGSGAVFDITCSVPTTYNATTDFSTGNGLGINLSGQLGVNTSGNSSAFNAAVAALQTGDTVTVTYLDGGTPGTTTQTYDGNKTNLGDVLLIGLSGGGTGSFSNVTSITFGIGSYSVLVQGGGTNYLAGHKVKILGSALGGTTPANDIVITVDAVNAGAITSVSNSGTPNAAAVGPYTAVAYANYLVGSGATFNYQKDPVNSNYSSYYNFNVNNSGSNYAGGDVLTISGDQLGGTSPANDLVFEVYTGQGGLAPVNSPLNPTGTAQTTTWRLATTTAVDFGQSGSWQLTSPLSRENLLIGDGFKRVYGTNTGDQTDRTYAIAVDSSDNIITATQGYGETGEAQQNTLAVIYKFNSTGTLQWARKLNELVYGAEGKGVTTIGTDIYITHYSYDDGDTIITKLNASGTVQWQRKVNSDSDSSITAASDGTLVVVAEAYNDDIGNSAIKLFKLTTNGETVYKRWLFADTNNSTRFKNGRCLYERDGSMYITSYYYAENNDSWFVARLPLDGSGTGEYGQFRYMDVNTSTGSYVFNNGLNSNANYVINELGSTYAGALTVEPYVDVTITSIASVGSDIYVDTYYPDYFWEEIRDQDGGNIVFADGTTQNTSATDTPQRVYTGAQYTLGMGDRGHHIYCVNQNRNILIPYNTRVEFPIGTTIVIVNATGNSVYVGTEGGGTSLMVSGSGGFYSGAEIYSNSVATLMKTGIESWVIYGDNITNW